MQKLMRSVYTSMISSLRSDVDKLKVIQKLYPSESRKGFIKSAEEDMRYISRQTKLHLLDIAQTAGQMDNETRKLYIRLLENQDPKVLLKTKDNRRIYEHIAEGIRKVPETYRSFYMLVTQTLLPSSFARASQFITEFPKEIRSMAPKERYQFKEQIRKELDRSS